MNKRITIKSLILALVLFMAFAFLPIGGKSPLAAGTQVMKSSTGSDLTYRNSSEKVYGLSEYDYPTAEYRAVWVSTFVGDLPSYTTESAFKASANTLLNNMVDMGMNAIVFHIRTHNNALYNSDLNPLASWWSRVDFDVFDPLEWLITECHARGIEFHAWMNPYRLGSQYVGEIPAGNPANDPSQILGSILDPGSQTVRDFLVDTCMEVIDRYDVDAIHFDDYFYVSGVAGNISANQKRANVDAFIHQLSDSIRANNAAEGRAVQLGISPSGIYRNGGYTSSPTYDSNGNLISPVYSNTSGFAHYDDYLYSDTKKWIDEEWIDYITPQSYWGMEHTGANFYELTRWWSWAVKNKKVNLYMGIGIYMADGTGTSATYWQKNPNEVQNQLLNAGMYDEINGTCFYKYTYMLSNNTIIKNGVNLIKNDYWNKRIPGAVIKSCADKLPSVPVSNLSLNGTTLSWDKMDKVFGYMVYQVPKGVALDKNNINHVYQYTQDTSVTGLNTLSYDYYVSSVNRANVVSEPVQYGYVPVDPSVQVVNAINALPSVITLEDETLVQSIRASYNALSDTQKAAVTNYNVLQNAEATISKYKDLKIKGEAFVATISKKINTDRILPVGTNMKWSYNDASDALRYNITNGKRLVNYIATSEIVLNLEITEDGYTYKLPVTFDLSFLPEGMTGLYYRNDPSAMSPNHVGQYTGTSSYIGWAEVTVTVGNNVLFVAANNYKSLTSSSDIPSAQWTSCAGVYTNDSSSNITMTIGDAFTTESSTYGYFIIGANKTIKSISGTSALSESVTLLPNEALFIIRYLDRIITGAPWVPATNLQVGTSAYITKYTETAVTPEEEGAAVKDAIDLLPNPVTLADEQKVNDLINLYNGLSNEAKAYVTNYSVLQNAVTQIANIKAAFAEYRTNKINELKNYVVLANYSAANQEVITQYLNNATLSINAATTESAIDQIVTSTKSSIDNVATLAEELSSIRSAKISEIQNYLNITEYSAAQQLAIETIINDAEAAINAATTESAINQIVTNAKNALNSIPTILEEYRASQIAALVDYVDYSQYSDLNDAVIEGIIRTATTSINSATTIAAIDQIVANAKGEIDNIPTSLEEIKKANIDIINDYVNMNNYSQSNQTVIQNIIESAISNINAATSESNVTEIVDNAKAEIDQVLTLLQEYKASQIAILNSYVELSNYNSDDASQITAIINEAIAIINAAPTIAAIDSAVEVTKDGIDAVPTLVERLVKGKEDAISELNTYVASLTTNSYETAEVNKIKTTAIAKINNADTLAKVATALTEGKDSCGQYISSLHEVKVRLTTYLNSIDPQLSATSYTEEQTRLVTELVRTGREQVEQAISNSVVEQLISDIERDYNAIMTKDASESGCKCKKNSAMYFITLLGALSSLLVVIRKKH